MINADRETILTVVGTNRIEHSLNNNVGVLCEALELSRHVTSLSHQSEHLLSTAFLVSSDYPPCCSD